MKRIRETCNLAMTDERIRRGVIRAKVNLDSGQRLDRSYIVPLLSQAAAWIGLALPAHRGEPSRSQSVETNDCEEPGRMYHREWRRGNQNSANGEGGRQLVHGANLKRKRSLVIPMKHRRSTTAQQAPEGSMKLGLNLLWVRSAPHMPILYLWGGGVPHRESEHAA
jgi:hypothetical protein